MLLYVYLISFSFPFKVADTLSIRCWYVFLWCYMIGIIGIDDTIFYLPRGGSRTAATSKMEPFVIIVNGFQPLTIITKRSILDVAAVLDPPLLPICSHFPSATHLRFISDHVVTPFSSLFSLLFISEVLLAVVLMLALNVIIRIFVFYKISKNFTHSLFHFISTSEKSYRPLSHHRCGNYSIQV